MIAFFFKYWKEILIPLTIIGMILGIYFYGKAEGKSIQKQRCNAKIFALNKASLDARDKLQTEVDKKSRAYEELKATNRRKQTEITRKLTDARKNNTIPVCPATAGFVQLYREVAGSVQSSESQPSR